MLESASDIPFEEIDEDLVVRNFESLEKLEETWEFFDVAFKAMHRVFGATALMAAGVYATHPSETSVAVSAAALTAGAVGLKTIAEPFIHDRLLQAEFNRVEFERAWDKYLGIDD